MTGSAERRAKPATKDGYTAPVIREVAPMPPPIPRSYALAVPTGDYPRKTLVPLYMDIHTVHGGATVDAVAQAHAADLKTQGAHDVRYLRYWVSEAEGKIFCLVDAPSAEAANTVHREAHGLVADDVFEVQEGL
jgi:hypothetical protein